MTVTSIGKTDEDAALVSAGLGIGSSAVGAASGVPVPSLRLPFGLGSLALEAEATGPRGEQFAALLWARGADVVTINARVAAEGDAHTLAKEYAQDLSKLLVTGEDPISDAVPDLPTAQGVREYLGGHPKIRSLRAIRPQSWARRHGRRQSRLPARLD